MSGITGIDAGRKLRENISNDKTLLIYISSHRNYHTDIIDLDVFCFIPKPIHKSEFNMKLTRAIMKILNQRQFLPFSDFVIEKNRSDIRIPMKSIIYLQSQLRQIHLYSTKDTYTYYGSLDIEEKKLPINMFCRIHKSFIVCFDHMTRITGQTVTMPDRTIPISAKYRDKVKAAYSRFRENQ